VRVHAFPSLHGKPSLPASAQSAAGPPSAATPAQSINAYSPNSYRNAPIEARARRTSSWRGHTELRALTFTASALCRALRTNGNTRVSRRRRCRRR
jgi:hypothetical protein